MKQRSRLMVLAVLNAEMFMAILSATIPIGSHSMGRDLGLSANEEKWAIASTIVAGLSLMILGVLLADRLGRRRAFLLGAAGMIVASQVCLMANSPEVLVLGRAGQGLAAALLGPAAVSLLTGLQPVEVARMRVIATLSAIGGVGAASGLLVGAVLTVEHAWRSIFGVEILIGLVILITAVRVLPIERDG